MSIPQFHTVVQLNNYASDYIIIGNYEKAIKDLATALKVSKQIMSSQAGSSPEALRSSSMTLDGCMRQGRLSGSCSTTTSEDEGESDCFNIYQCPIHVKPTDDAIMEKSCCNEDDTEFNVVSSAILFNLALAHHLSAKKAKRQQRRASLTRLEKAARLYELASHLEQKRFTNGTNPLFMMAIVNNLGAIHHELNERENAQLFFQHLLSTMLFITEYSNGEEKEKVVSEDVNEIFFNNVMHLIFQGGGKNYCTAAAA